MEPRDVPYLYELFLSQEKFKKAIGLATTLHTTFDLHNLTWMCNTILLRNNGLNQNKNWQIKLKSDMTENALIRVLHI